MNKALLTVLALLLAVLACSKATPTPSANTPAPVPTLLPTPTPVPTLTETPVPTLAPIPVIVLAETLNCRETANTDSKVLAVLPENARFEVLAQEGEWYQVLPAPGAATCWIYQDWTVYE